LRTPEHQFAALALDYELLLPHAATGLPSGKRQHSPVSVVKEWGAASPQLFQALVTNEVLETVEIECHGVLEDGTKGIVHKLMLWNANVASIRQSAGGDAGPRELETVAFSFEAIEHLSPKGETFAKDSRVSPA